MKPSNAFFSSVASCAHQSMNWRRLFSRNVTPKRYSSPPSTKGNPSMSKNRSFGLGGGSSASPWRGWSGSAGITRNKGGTTVPAGAFLRRAGGDEAVVEDLQDRVVAGRHDSCAVHLSRKNSVRTTNRRRIHTKNGVSHRAHLLVSGRGGQYRREPSFVFLSVHSWLD